MSSEVLHRSNLRECPQLRNTLSQPVQVRATLPKLSLSLLKLARARNASQTYVQKPAQTAQSLQNIQAYLPHALGK